MKIIPFLFFLLYCENSSLNFSNGLSPINFDLESDAIKDLEDAKSCKNCHKEVYQNWFNSRHRVSFTNELYQESHKREPRNWCINCHAPLIKPNGIQSKLEDRILKEEGISCNVCHVREKKILVEKLPILKEKKYFHEYKLEKKYGDRNFCADCHQFNFPTIESARNDKNFHYSKLEMQNTLNEFNSSFFNNLGECKTCHLEAYSKNTHSFFGGHSKNKLSESIELEIEKITETKISIKIIGIGIAHSFPTGDLFRTLRLKLIEPKSKKFITEIYLKKIYEENNSKDKNSPSMILASDNRLEPPKSSHVSEKNFIIEIPKDIHEIEAIFYMDYLHGLNRIETKLNPNLSFLEFKNKKFKLTKPKSKG